MLPWVLCLFALFATSFAQPENRFNPFDWVQYRTTGAINSISSDNRYVYFGTHEGGVGRYLLFGHRFDEPITRAQGLNSNTVTAVHAAFGTLWVATPGGLNYSYTREGDWHFITSAQLGLPPYTLIDRIGNSRDYLWLMTPGMFYKCDRSSGIVLSMMPVPDEQEIHWSSGIFEFDDRPEAIIANFVPLNGWIQQQDSFISPRGKTVSVTTLFRDFYGDVWVGTSDGTLFYGDRSMKTMTPLFFGLSGNDIQVIGRGESFWLAGRYGGGNTGISYVDPRRDIYDRYEYSETVNMDPISVFSILVLKGEIWFGGRGTVLTYNRQKDYWRSLGLDRGFPEGTYYSMVSIGDRVWIGSSQGLFQIDRKTKRHQEGELETVFTNRFIYDLLVDQDRLWIASEDGLFIYNTDSNILVNYRKFGQADLDSLPVEFTDFTRLVKSDSVIYAASEGGIFRFDLHSWKWSKAVDPTLFGGKMVRAMAVKGANIFVSTGEGLLRYQMKRRILKKYNYPFIGEINDMYISRGRIWLGTTEGLISFAWIKD